MLSIAGQLSTGHISAEEIELILILFIAKIDTNLKLEMYDKMSDTAPKIGIDQKPNSDLYLLTTIRHASNYTTLLTIGEDIETR